MFVTGVQTCALPISLRWLLLNSRPQSFTQRVSVSSSFCRSTVTTLLFIPEECVGLPWGPVTREGEGERREDQRQRGKAIAGRHLKPRQRQGPPASL